MKKLSALLLALMLTLGSGTVALAAEQDTSVEATASATETPAAEAADAPQDTPEETPAPEENIPATVIGDADRNGVVNINDATLIQRFAAELVTADALDALATDVNRDGDVNIGDATIIQRYIAEFIADFSEWAPKKELTLNETALSLRVSDTAQLTTSYTAEDGAVHFASNLPEVAAVDGNGMVTATGVGEAVITATADNGMTAVCTVTVQKALVPLTLNHTALTLGTGDCKALVTSVENNEGVTFTSADETIAAVDAQGVITAAGIGETEITASIADGQTAQCSVTVVKGVSQVTLSSYAQGLDIGEQFTLVAYIGSDEYSCGGDFTTDNEAVATVSVYGTVTAVAYGTAHVSYTTANGVSAACEVTVCPSPDSVSISPVNLILSKGETYALGAAYDNDNTAFGARFASDNTSVATVDSRTGVVTAKSTGYATLTVTSVNGLTANCYLTVKAAPAYVGFLNNEVKMIVGEETPLYLRNSLDDTVVNDATYVSGNPEVVAVTADGRATALKEGSATVTATSYNGKTASVAITVLSNAGSNTKTITAAVYLRTDTVWNAPSVVTLKKGATVNVFDTSANGRWVKAKYGNKIGWIYNKAVGVSKNYTTINNDTLPAVADDKIFDLNVNKRAIYNFVYNDISYVNTDDDTTENLCVYAFKRGRGSCYHHAALIEYLYNRCGWETVRIVGIDWLTGGSDHSWCIVKTADGWRHVDAQEIITYSGTFDNSNQYFVKDSLLSNYFSWDRNKYPAAV